MPAPGATGPGMAGGAEGILAPGACGWAPREPGAQAPVGADREVESDRVRGRTGVRRRVVLGWAVGSAGVAVFAAPGAAAATGGRVGAGRAVGRATVRVAAVRAVAVEGTGMGVRVLAGPAATVLVYVARRFHYEIDTLRAGDLVGDVAGTAIDIRPGWYPAGVTGGFLPHQLIVVRDILAECDGVLRWGGDRRELPTESRFELAVPATDPRLRAVAARLGRPGARPGAQLARPFTAARRKQADALRRRMTSG